MVIICLLRTDSGAAARLEGRTRASDPLAGVFPSIAEPLERGACREPRGQEEEAAAPLIGRGRPSAGSRSKLVGGDASGWRVAAVGGGERVAIAATRMP